MTLLATRSPTSAQAPIPSRHRGGMRIAVYEGVIALVLMNLLGGPFLTGYLLELGANSTQIGLALAIQPLANTLQLIAAILMQRLSNRKLALSITGGAHRILWALTGAIPFILAKPYWIPVFFIIYSTAYVMNAFAAVIWSSLISDMVPARVRGRYFGMRNAICWAVGSVTLLVSGQIMDARPGLDGFQILFMIGGVFAVLNLIAYTKYSNPPFERSTETSGSRMLAKPLKDRSFFGASLFVAVFILVQNIAVPLFSYVMLDVLHISYSWVSILTTVQMVFIMIGYYTWGNLNAKYPTRTLLFWTFPVLASACLVWLLDAAIPALIMLFIAQMLLGFGLGGYQLLSFTFMIGDTPKPDRPMYVAVFSAMTGLTGFLGPMIGGFIYASAKSAPLWVQSYGITAASGAAMLALLGWGHRILFKK